jgi:antitoxin VapB
MLHESGGMIDLSQETELLARRLANARHVTIDDAVREALEASAHAAGMTLSRPRDTSSKAVAARREHVARFVEELAAMPVIDKRPLSEIVDDLNAI